MGKQAFTYIHSYWFWPGVKSESCAADFAADN